MSEDNDISPQTYNEWTPFYKVGLSPSVMPEQLTQILWEHYIENLGVLYIALSNFPEPFETLCSVLNVDSGELEQELIARLSTKFISEASSYRDSYQLLLNPVMEKLSRYVQYCDLLAVPGVIGLTEYNNGKNLAVHVSMSRSDIRTPLMLPTVHAKTGLPIQLLHEH